MTSTKKSLAFSALSLVICLAMLIGTTFAWFTDSVESGKNQIIAGNLDVELLNGTTPVDTSTKLFSKVAKWEPGAAAFETLQVKNVGYLALKYQLSFLFENETKVDGHGLSEALKIGFYKGTVAAGAKREDVIAAVTDWVDFASFTKNGNLVANQADDAITYVIYWQPGANDNLFNMNNDNKGQTLSIDFWVKLVATQDTVEADSFDKFYDAETPWLGGTADVPAEVEGVITINTAEELAGFAKAVNSGTTYGSKTIKLAKDIDLNNIAWTPIKANNNEQPFIFDGNSKTIKNLNVAGEKAVGLFAYATSCTIKNLTIDGATATGINHVAAIAGNALCTKIENCTVKNAVITTAVKNNDDGDKAGAIAGYLSGESEAHITGCTVENVTVTGYRDIGALLGIANGTSTVKNNTVKNSTVINDRSNNYKNYTTDAEFDVNAVVGEAVPAATVSDNTATNVNVVAGASVEAAVTKAIKEATEGDTILLPATDKAIELPATMNKGVTIVGNGDDTALKVENDVKITGPVTFENLSIALNDTTDLNGSINVTGNATFKDITVTLDENGVSPKRGIVVGGGSEATFENVNFALDGKTRGIMVWGGSPKIYVKNCTFDCVYPFNVDGGSPEFIVTDSTLNGWTSYGGTTKASLTNCKFGMSTSEWAFLRPYTNTTLTNCEFSADYRLDCGAEGVVITLNNCTQNGAPVTTSIIEPTGSQANGKLVIDGTEYPITK
ncbi:MAG: SipW-dependent-type signal peptide-containing protein [Clostridiales bacterium]|nr:SipW-dependent-type signal peptide-containing protein [Candidatus Equinaster intestinalis]